jgi:hypothetical protein
MIVAYLNKVLFRHSPQEYESKRKISLRTSDSTAEKLPCIFRIQVHSKEQAGFNSNVSRRLVLILAGKPTIPTQVFRDYPQSHHVNNGIIP